MVTSIMASPFTKFKNRHGTPQTSGKEQSDNGHNDLDKDLSREELLTRSGLATGRDGRVHWSKNSFAHPRNWSKLRKFNDLFLIISLDFMVSGVGAAGTIAATFAMDDLHVSRIVSISAFTTL